MRLPAELYLIAEQLGYTAEELATYDVGVLLDDFAIDIEDIFLRGALVLLDENGFPSALFNKPLFGLKSGAVRRGIAKAG